MAEPQARFTTVVAKAGKPVLHLGWLPLPKDTGLKAAIAAERVMTLHQVLRGGRKDFGIVGFESGPQTQILIFPKSLRKFRDRRIVAIDYTLLVEPGKMESGKVPPPGHTFVSSRSSRSPMVPPASVKPLDETKLPHQPVKEPPPEEPPPLTWAEAVATLEKIKRGLRGRPAASIREIDALLQRVKERLQPH